jgi:hypothetical protein
MMSPRLTRSLAAGAAVVTLAVSGFALGNSGSGSSTGTATASGPANTTQAAAPTKAQPTGQIPQGWQQGDGTLITGAAADKVKALALANYAGTVNRVLKLSDGSYVAHMFANPAGPHHVFVSKDFKITGTV